VSTLKDLTDNEVIRSQGFSEAGRRVMNITQTAGAAALHSQYPDEYEYYLCTFEVLNPTTMETIEYLTFPIMPDSIRIADSKIQSTTKTANGVVVIENNTFTLKTISVSGNFGRKFKLVDFKIQKTESKSSDAAKGSKIDQVYQEIISGMKTGYGTCKTLQRMLESSSKCEDGSPRLLLFYCYAFNANYLVQLVNNSFEMSKNMNRIWTYSFTLKALAPADAIMDSDTLKQTLSKYINNDVLRNGVKQVVQFTSNQSKILGNQLLLKVNDNLGLLR
jgi:hypothetical protein